MELEKVADDRLTTLVEQLQTEGPCALFVAELIKSVLHFKYTGWEVYVLTGARDTDRESNTNGGNGGASVTQHFGVVCANRETRMHQYTMYAKQSADIVGQLKPKISCCATNVFFAIPLELTSPVRAMFREGAMEEYPSFTYFLRDYRKLPEIPEDNQGSGIVVRKIGEEFASLINATWKHKRDNTEDSIREELRVGFGYGIFVDENIVSWIILRKYGGMGLLHTLPEFRGRGYASIVTSALIRDATALGMTPYVQVERDNSIAVKFYEKLGFEKGEDSAVIVPKSLETKCCI